LKLSLFYLVLSLPALVLVEWTIIGFEFRELFAAVDAGRLGLATQRAEVDIGTDWSEQSIPSDAELAVRADSLILSLERPHDGLAPGSYVMLELSRSPVSVVIFDATMRPRARAPLDSTIEIPSTLDPIWDQATATTYTNLPGMDSPEKVRRVLAAIHGSDGHRLGWVLVELRLPLPWHRLIGEVSFEWPIMLACLVIFSLASAFFLVRWVTRRLNRIGNAAANWSRGDFSTLIVDASNDELGRLSAGLNSMALELKSLMRSRAQLASMEERQRLARDLHDTVKQKAFALNLQVSAARRLLGEQAHPGALQRLEDAGKLIGEIQQELAQVLDELRAPPPQGFLAPRLRDLAQRWSRIYGLALHLDLDEHVRDDVVQGEALLRISEEALANVLRHSGATEVSLSLRREDEQLELHIADNGVGGADYGDGMGLANMRERAMGLPDGTFQLSSAPGAGTVVRVRCRNGA
ncbi:MAG: sensor histidine kinase, partial [Tahibacter sp.]